MRNKSIPRTRDNWEYFTFAEPLKYVRRYQEGMPGVFEPVILVTLSLPKINASNLLINACDSNGPQNVFSRLRNLPHGPQTCSIVQWMDSAPTQPTTYLSSTQKTQNYSRCMDAWMTRSYYRQERRFVVIFCRPRLCAQNGYLVMLDKSRAYG